MPGLKSKVKPDQLTSHLSQWKDVDNNTVMAVDGKQGEIYNTAVVVFPIGKPAECEIWYLAWQPEEDQAREQREEPIFHDRQISEIIGWWVPAKGKEPFLVLKEASVGESSASYSFVISNHGRIVGKFEEEYSPAGEGGDFALPEYTYKCDASLSVGKITLNCRHPDLPDETANIKNLSYCWTGKKVEPCK
jgi:hypothetical protein